MNLGWISQCHQVITHIVIDGLPFTTEEKALILKGSVEPDEGLPFNFSNHIQTPTKGNAKETIIKEMGKNTLRHLGHALHFVQDLCVLYHTTDTPIIDHIAYETSVKCMPIFHPDRKVVIFKDGLSEGLDNLIATSRLENPTRERMTLAAYASYELCLLYLEFNGRKY